MRAQWIFDVFRFLVALLFLRVLCALDGESCLVFGLEVASADDFNGLLRSARNSQCGFQSAPRKIAQTHRTAMRLRDVAGNRQAKAAAAGIAVA